ncbi:MAG: adenine deaminase [Anaerostipes sp.]|nr:adenine deaminase [Anaerostipes sp.]MBS7008968.1 adenine deaminase [Anaerostipes sp.]
MAYDLVFKNGTIVDVRNKTCFRADLAVSEGKIAEIGNLCGEKEIDCTGKVLCPGFIDAHVHIESSMAAPREFANAVLPHGTTTVIADPHEMVNVRGNEAMRYLLDATENLPISVYVMLPSSIPSTPFETNGADFTSKDMEAWINHPRILGLGEVMCYPDVLAGRREIMDKIELCRHKVIDGHAPGLTGEALRRYVKAGVMTDHECTSFEEAEEKRKAGMKILVREGSAARNVEAIVRGLAEKGSGTDGFLFCTDDKHLDTIEQEGHISFNVKKSIQLGLKPEEAIAMATWNAAQTYGLPSTGCLEKGYDADIVVLNSLEDIKVLQVYKKGISCREILSDSREADADYGGMLQTVNLKPFGREDLSLHTEGRTPVIGLVPGQIITRYLLEEVPSENGLFQPDSIYSKLCVFERHRGTGSITAAPLKGYGITGGAIATSVAHDSHNIIAAGDCDEDIIKAVEIIREMQGGYALVRHGKEAGRLPLPIAGLMSTWPASKIQERIDTMVQTAREMNISKDCDPFITLSFLALPVIPELRLTDKGLVDVSNYQLIKDKGE